MIEVRRITMGEAEDFLRLLCRVFELDVSFARSVFFQEPMFDIRRKWALFVDNEMVSILSTTPVEFGWGKGIGIAGVATDKGHRGNGYASMLLDAVNLIAISENEGASYLFASNPSLYEKNGFKVIDEVIRGSILEAKTNLELPSASKDDVKRIYEKWQKEHPDRLIRDARRWQLWQWNLRFSVHFGEGYVCSEGPNLREAIVNQDSRRSVWPVQPDTEWIGLKSMTEQLGPPLLHCKSELYLLAKNTDKVPQMFLTDQF